MKDFDTVNVMEKIGTRKGLITGGVKAFLVASLVQRSPSLLEGRSLSRCKTPECVFRPILNDTLHLWSCVR